MPAHRTKPGPTGAENPGRAVARPSQRAAVLDAVTIAEQKGFLKGSRSHVIRGRMPAGLVAEAKRRTGIHSDSKLLEAALASMAVADEYAEWLFAQRGSVDAGLDLEF